MSKTKYPIFKCLRHGEKGFTLIELLIVVAILGIMAAVVIPNAARFFGRGTVEAANTEAATVRTAVAAYVASGGDVPATGTIGSARTCTGFTVDDDGLIPISYFEGSVQATYTIDTDDASGCMIPNAVPPAGWSLNWTAAACEWQET